MTKRVAGSLKNKVVASELLEERANCNFDQQKMRVLVHGGQEQFDIYKELMDDMAAPELQNTFGYMEKDVNGKQIELWHRNKYVFEKLGHKYIKNDKRDIAFDFPYIQWSLSSQGQAPGLGLHGTMFWLTVQNLSNDEQLARWMPEVR